MMDLLLPLQFPFMHGAFYIALLIGPPTALLSCFLVLKGWSLMGDAVSHAVLPGIVIAYIIGLPLIVGAFIAGMICSLLIGYLDANSRVRQDTVMGVVFSGMFGFGLVLYTKIETNIHLDHILFGDMLGISDRDVIETAVISGIALVLVIALRRDLSMRITHAFGGAGRSGGEDDSGIIIDVGGGEIEFCRVGLEFCEVGIDVQEALLHLREGLCRDATTGPTQCESCGECFGDTDQVGGIGRR